MNEYFFIILETMYIAIEHSVNEALYKCCILLFYYYNLSAKYCGTISCMQTDEQKILKKSILQWIV